MMEIALVGTPNSGKSTFFKAATLKDVKIANYPFTTLEPNEGLAYATAKCPCKDLQLQCKKCTDGTRFVPLKLWDVAGLVKDAHLGKGHGNAFLDDVMQAEAIILVVDASGRTDMEGNPAKGFDPNQAVKMLQEEIDYWILGIIKKISISKRPDITDKNLVEAITKQLTGLRITKEIVEEVISYVHISKHSTDDELLKFCIALRKKAKPMIVAANKIDITGAAENVKTMQAVPCSAEVELALREAAKDGIVEYAPGEKTFHATDKQVTEKQTAALNFMKKFLEKNGTGVQQIINSAAFDLLHMIVVYPVENENRFSDKAGNVLPDAFLVPKGTTAKQLAYRIHEDIGKSFITAVDAKTKKNIGANHILNDGDIISVKSGK